MLIARPSGKNLFLCRRVSCQVIPEKRTRFSRCALCSDGLGYSVFIDFGSESICKSNENNIASDDFLAEVRIVAFVYRLRCDGCFAVPIHRPRHARTPSQRKWPEFLSKIICRWLKEADVKTLFVLKGSPWEKGSVESFKGTLHVELLNREIFLNFEQACWVIDRWRRDYKHHRIHSSLDFQTPAAYAAGCVLPVSATPQPPEHSQITNPRIAHLTWCDYGGVAIPTCRQRVTYGYSLTSG